MTLPPKVHENDLIGPNMLKVSTKSIGVRIGLGIGMSCLVFTLLFFLLSAEYIQNLLAGNTQTSDSISETFLETKHNTFFLWQVILSVVWTMLSALTCVLWIKGYLSKSIGSITHVLENASQGDFTSRLQPRTRDEMGQLAERVNQLLASLTEMQASKINTDMELDSAHRELKLKTQLEEKNRIIEKTNLTLTRRLRDIALLYDLNRALISSLQLDQVLNVITEKIGDALGFDALGFSELLVFLISHEHRKLKLVRSLGRLTPSHQLGKLVEPLHGHLAQAMRSRNPILVKNMSNAPTENTYNQLLPASGSLLSVPIHTQEHLLGVLCFMRKEVDSFSEDEIQLLTSVTQLAAMAVLNAQLFKEKLDLSITDELTQLANRRHMQSRLEIEWNRAIRLNKPLSALMVDIDQFKRYNDINGHLLGDEVLKIVARILEENTRSVDTVARFGGEEFVVVLPGQEKSAAINVAEKLRRAVSVAQFPRANRQPAGRLTISVGIANYPLDAENPKQLLDKSDLALYVAKRTGRDCTITYEDGMEQIEDERLRAKNESKKRAGRRKTKSRQQLNLLEH